jgi:hypothetical protein
VGSVLLTTALPLLTKENAISNFHDTLNSIDPHINFTIEHDENDGQIAFLDTLVSRQSNYISIDVYRKPTHLQTATWTTDYASHHDLKHKINVATTVANTSLKLSPMKASAEN